VFFFSLLALLILELCCAGPCVLVFVAWTAKQLSLSWQVAHWAAFYSTNGINSNYINKTY
jgi:hypothetical protein